MFDTTKLAAAAVTGVLSLAVTGAAAFAAFPPDGAATLVTATDDGPRAAAAEREGARDRLKDALDKLVEKGVITKAQEDAILAAIKGAGDRDGRGHTLGAGDLMKLSAEYLGLPKEDLAKQLRAGKSLGEIANATGGKSRDALITFDVAKVGLRIDQAVLDGKITAERAAAMKARLVERVTAFVDHTRPQRPVKPETKGGRHAKPSPSPSASPTT